MGNTVCMSVKLHTMDYYKIANGQNVHKKERVMMWLDPWNCAFAKTWVMSDRT